MMNQLLIPMRDWFTKDFYWKAFSLLMAVGIWLTVRKDVEMPVPPALAVSPITYGNLPVQAVSGDVNVRDARLVPPTVTATISGMPAVMNQLQRSQIHVFVNLSGLNPAQNVQQDVEISLPKGATVNEIVPPQVTVVFSKQQ